MIHADVEPLKLPTEFLKQPDIAVLATSDE